MLKYLLQFQSFSCEAFFKDKRLMVTSIKELTDYDTKAVIGTRLEIAITHDGTQYKQKPGTHETNRFEKIIVKVSKDLKDVSARVAIDCYINLINPVGVVYGEYKNQLSVSVSDVQVIQVQAKPKAATV